MNPKIIMRISGWVLLALCAAILAQEVLPLPYRLRFISDQLNYWTFALAAFYFPLLMGLLAFTVSVRWARYVIIVFVCILLIPCFFFASCAAIDAPRNGDVDLSYERISETVDGPVVYRLYRKNCGATCANGLSLRKERDLLLGTKVVSGVWGANRVSQVQVVLKESKVLVLEGDKILAELPR